MRTLAAFLAFLLLATLVFRPRPRPETEPATCARIVSILPSVTELVFAAGAGAEVVGVTDWCDFPPQVRALPRVGGIFVDAERILSLSPDVVLASGSTSRSNAALAHLGLRVSLVETDTFDQIIGSLRSVGRLTGHEAEGERAAVLLESRIHAVAAAVVGRPAPTVLFESGGETILAAGPTSHVGDAIRRAGGTNVMADQADPWARVPWEVVLHRNPDVILMAHHRGAELRRTGWSSLDAVKNGRVHRVPTGAFLHPSPRLAEGLELAARLIHGTK